MNERKAAMFTLICAEQVTGPRALDVIANAAGFAKKADELAALYVAPDSASREVARAVAERLWLTPHVEPELMPPELHVPEASSWLRKAERWLGLRAPVQVAARARATNALARLARLHRCDRVVVVAPKDTIDVATREIGAYPKALVIHRVELLPGLSELHVDVPTCTRVPARLAPAHPVSVRTA